MHRYLITYRYGYNGIETTSTDDIKSDWELNTLNLIHAAILNCTPSVPRDAQVIILFFTKLQPTPHAH